MISGATPAHTANPSPIDRLLSIFGRWRATPRSILQLIVMTGRDSTRAGARTITVKVTFFADLRRFLPRGADGPQPYTLPDRATVDDLLAVIGVAPKTDVTIAVDGEQAARETTLRDGADVMLLSPMEGGA
jgi:sulfur carrier protein ThiS